MDKMPKSHGHRINLLLVNETLLMGNVIAAALEGEPDINIVGCVISIDEALNIVREKEVDVALVSTRLPDLGALKLTNAITELKPSTKCLPGLTAENTYGVLGGRCKAFFER